MFVIQRAAEHSAVNRRIFVQGIVKIINGNQLSWVNLSDSSYPCSDKEILVYSDRYTTANPPQSAPPPLTENQSSGNAGTYPYESALPTGQLPSLALVGQGANFYVKIDFGARYKAQSIQAEIVYVSRGASIVVQLRHPSSGKPAVRQYVAGVDMVLEGRLFAAESRERRRCTLHDSLVQRRQRIYRISSKRRYPHPRVGIYRTRG